MYQHHYGLTEYPFTLTPNTSFFYASNEHKDAFNMLLFAIKTGEGFIKITGEIGMGKTLLCRKLINSLPNEYHTAYIPNPSLDILEMLRSIAEELGANVSAQQSERDVVKRIEARLVALAKKGKRPVVVIDEAQALSDNALECIRLISNLETEKRKLVQIVLFGQPELEIKLHQPNLRQLRQRISFSCKLLPMSRKCMSAYLNHRLLQAGYSGDRLFSYPATWLLYSVSGGVPRLINIFCHKALLSGYGKGDRRVKFSHMWRAIKDTDAGSYFTYWRQRRMNG